MEIELATETDIPALCQLLNELFTQEAEFQADEAAQCRGLAAIIADPAIGHILVARQEGRVLGMVSLLYSISTALGARVAWLEDMVVAAEFRGAGYGRLLLERAISFAQAQGCRRLTLLTDVDNLRAQQFYLKQGFCISTMLPLRRGLGES